MKRRTAYNRCGFKDRSDVCTKVGAYHTCNREALHTGKCRCSCGRNFDNDNTRE